MRRIGTLLGAGALLLAVAACADSDPQPGFGGQPPTVTSQAPDEVKTPEGTVKVAKERVTPPANSDDRQTVVWTANDGKTVGTYAQEGGCGKAHAELAEQTDQQVKIALIEVVPKPEAKKMCTMDIRYPEVSVDLAQPLGERKIVLESRTETEK